jgi:hypothetical protein
MANISASLLGPTTALSGARLYRASDLKRVVMQIWRQRTHFFRAQYLNTADAVRAAATHSLHDPVSYSVGPK